jgi:hypothetical protein
MFQHFILHSQRQTAKEFATPDSEQVDDLANGVPPAAAAVAAVDEAAGIFKDAQRKLLVEDVLEDDDPSPEVTFLLFACV